MTNKTAERSDPAESGGTACSLFELVADTRRRSILETVLEGEADRVEFSTLVEEIADREGASRESVTVDLHHRQLPELDEDGVIEYDRYDGTVRFEGDEAIERVLR